VRTADREVIDACLLITHAQHVYVVLSCTKVCSEAASKGVFVRAASSAAEKRCIQRKHQKAAKERRRKAQTARRAVRLAKLARIPSTAAP